MQSYRPSDEERKLYNDYLAEINKRELTSIDNFDKSVLTLSSAGLGLSLSFLKDLAGQPALWPWSLYVSWMLFVVATVSTMLSFIASSKALDHHKDVVRRAYILGDENAFSESNIWNSCTIRLNQSSAVAFCAALVLTVLFVIINVESRQMPASKNIPTSTTAIQQRGQPVPTLQRPASAPTTGGSQPVSAPSQQTGNTGNTGK